MSYGNQLPAKPGLSWIIQNGTSPLAEMFQMFHFWGAQAQRGQQVEHITGLAGKAQAASRCRSKNKIGISCRLNTKKLVRRVIDKLARHSYD